MGVKQPPYVNRHQVLSTVDGRLSLFIALMVVQLCIQRAGRDAVRRAGSSATYFSVL